MCALEVRNLSVDIADKHVLKNITLKITNGQIHALLGQNGAGKSSLAKSIIKHPECKIINGEIIYNDIDVTKLEPEEIAKFGIFMAFQNPPEIEGVSVANFIRAALQTRMKKGDKFIVTDFYKKLYDNMSKLSLDKSFSSRSLNVGFSGGEKKRCEMLQMLMLQPQFVILDEIDSGLDIDAVKVIINCINSLKNSEFSALIITHNNKILKQLNPDIIHIMSDGEIVESGDDSLIEKLEKQGFHAFKQNEE